MSQLIVNKICLSFGDRTLLKDVSFTLKEKARCALAGANGEGKTTLMKIIAGEVPCDSGVISTSKDCIISYLPQSDVVLRDRNVYEEIGSQMPQDIEDYRRNLIISSIAEGLGFSQQDLSRTCSEFSGGYQMRIALARTLAKNPDVMLLDEPTNYLDIDARMWLLKFLKNYKGSFLLVCHDRGFLDNTVDEVLELFNAHLSHYTGNYSAYEKKRLLEIKQLEQEALNQSEMIEKTQQFIDRFRYKATKAKQVQSRIKALEKIERIEVPSHLKTINFTFPQPDHSPNDVVVIENMTKKYGTQVIYEDFSLYVGKGTRLAVTGHNGVGKSTLLRIIAKQDSAYTGQVKLGPGVSIGYYAQDTADSLDLNGTVLSQVLDYGTENEIRNALGSFLFHGDDIYKKVSVLSGGERSRLALLKILLRPANLLILDEPTNHFDLNSKTMLLRALSKYKGTLIFVSHDTDFIKNLATQILYLSDYKPFLIKGDYDYFEYHLSHRQESGAEEPVKAVRQLSAGEARAEELKNKSRRRKQERESQQILEELERTAKALEELEEKINLPENYSDFANISELVSQKNRMLEQKASLETKWLEMNED